jgi:hypothetical protein
LPAIYPPGSQLGVLVPISADATSKAMSLLRESRLVIHDRNRLYQIALNSSPAKSGVFWSSAIVYSG